MKRFARSPSADARTMNICVVVDNPLSWFVPFAKELVSRLSSMGQTALLQSAEEIPTNNEIAFLLSCEKKVSPPILARSRHNIVVHASQLPQGKGMSPMTWQILEGKDVIPLSLFEAAEAIDSGTVYLRDSVHFKGNELLNEMQAKLGVKIVQMCERFLGEYPDIIKLGQPQKGPETIYRRRRPADSQLDPQKTIAEQFNLLRVVDNERYPAFFEWRGRRFVLSVSPAKEGAE